MSSIFNWDCLRNLIAKILVKVMKQVAVEHPKPHPVGFFPKDTALTVNDVRSKWAFKVELVDEIDIVVLDICEVILGRPYLAL